MNQVMQYYQKRYNLEIIEEDGEIKDIYHIVNGNKIKMVKEENRWVCKDGNYVLCIPNICN